MDVLSSLFSKVGALGFLQPLSNESITQRILLYVDDMILFIKPCEEEMALGGLKLLHN
jgi:hypothetical protein